MVWMCVDSFADADALPTDPALAFSPTRAKEGEGDARTSHLLQGEACQNDRFLFGCWTEKSHKELLVLVFNSYLAPVEGKNEGAR